MFIIKIINCLSLINRIPSDSKSKYGICPFLTKANRVISEAYDIDLNNYSRIIYFLHFYSL